MKIANIDIDGYAALAPMAGVADTAFRTICKGFGASLVVGEMASSKALTLTVDKTAEFLRVTDIERPMAVQIFGSDPEIMAVAAKLTLKYKPDMIDINMGCPAPKVTCSGAGSALLKDTALVSRIVKSVSSAVDIPVTVKIRIGWDNFHINAVEIAKAAEQNGASAIICHGRTREQMYCPPVNIEMIAAVKKAVGIPVIGNGDINTPEAAKYMFDNTACDLVMVGRGALGQPWIFKAINEYMKYGTYNMDFTANERMQIMLKHIDLILKEKGDFIGMLEARKHAAWYVKGFRGASQLRKEACMLKCREDAHHLAEKVLEYDVLSSER